MSHDATGATFSVTFGGGICTAAPPVVSVTPLSQTGSAGQALQYTVTLTNKDSPACSNVTFNLTGTVPTGWGSSFSPASLQAAPGGSANSVWTVTAPAGTADGSYGTTAAATDAADAAHTASTNATTVIFTDTLPPTVSIDSPFNGAEISGQVTVTASASDDRGVTQVEFYVDGGLKATDTSDPYSYRWSTIKEAAGPHTLQAKAYDAAGHSGSSALVNVTVKRGKK